MKTSIEKFSERSAPEQSCIDTSEVVFAALLKPNSFTIVFEEV